jgi:hypothetical protein
MEDRAASTTTTVRNDGETAVVVGGFYLYPGESRDVPTKVAKQAKAANKGLKLLGAEDADAEGGPTPLSAVRYGLDGTPIESPPGGRTYSDFTAETPAPVGALLDQGVDALIDPTQTPAAQPKDGPRSNEIAQRDQGQEGVTDADEHGRAAGAPERGRPARGRASGR